VGNRRPHTEDEDEVSNVDNTKIQEERLQCSFYLPSISSLLFIQLRNDIISSVCISFYLTKLFHVESEHMLTF
jgi:hypothetical protein